MAASTTREVEGSSSVTAAEVEVAGAASGVAGDAAGDIIDGARMSASGDEDMARACPSR